MVHVPQARLSLPPYQPRLIFMAEYYEKINHLILVFIEPCHELDTPSPSCGCSLSTLIEWWIRNYPMREFGKSTIELHPGGFICKMTFTVLTLHRSTAHSEGGTLNWQLMSAVTIFCVHNDDIYCSAVTRQSQLRMRFFKFTQEEQVVANWGNLNIPPESCNYVIWLSVWPYPVWKGQWDSWQSIMGGVEIESIIMKFNVE